MRMFKSLRRFYESPTFLWFLIGLGVLLRLVRFLSHRSLWLDEAQLALAVVESPFIDLFTLPHHDQMAPPGFLILSKVMVSLFGIHELVLRFIPFVSSIVVLWVFMKLAQKILIRPLVPLALFALVINDGVIYYAAEFKQYQFEILVTTTLLLLATRISSSNISLRTALCWGIAGAVLPWISYSSVFFLGALGASLFFLDLRERSSRRTRSMLGAYALWAASIALLYFLVLLPQKDYPAVHGYWVNVGAFAPLDVRIVPWFVVSLSIFLKNPFGLSVPAIPLLLMACGAVAFVRRQPLFVLLGIFCILLPALASTVEMYAFSHRLLLFLTPVFLLLIVQGIESIGRALHMPIVAAALAFVLFWQPIVTAYAHTKNPPPRDEIRPMIEYLLEHYRDGDAVYVAHGAQYAFRYYQYQLNAHFDDLFIEQWSPRQVELWRDSIEKFRGRRVWSVVSHIRRFGADGDLELLFGVLDPMGVRLDEKHAHSAAVLLYQL